MGNIDREGSMKKLLLVLVGAAACASAVASATPPQADVRFATFNASLNRPSDGLLRRTWRIRASTTSSAGRRRTSPR